MAKTYEQHMQGLRESVPQAGEPPPATKRESGEDQAELDRVMDAMDAEHPSLIDQAATAVGDFARESDRVLEDAPRRVWRGMGHVGDSIIRVAKGEATHDDVQNTLAMASLDPSPWSYGADLVSAGLYLADDDKKSAAISALPLGLIGGAGAASALAARRATRKLANVKVGKAVPTPEEMRSLEKRATAKPRWVRDPADKGHLDATQRYADPSFGMLPGPAVGKGAHVEQVNATPWFHGITNSRLPLDVRLDTYDPSKIKRATGSNLGPGLYITDNVEEAVNYSKGLYGPGRTAVKAVEVDTRSLIQLSAQPGSALELASQLEARGAPLAAAAIRRSMAASKTPAGVTSADAWRHAAEMPGGLHPEVRELAANGVDGVQLRSASRTMGRQNNYLVLFDPAGAAKNGHKSLRREGRIIPDKVLYGVMGAGVVRHASKPDQEE